MFNINIETDEILNTLLCYLIKYINKIYWIFYHSRYFTFILNSMYNGFNMH